MITADSIEFNEIYVITKVQDSDVSLRLTELGCTPGTTIVRVFDSPLHDPIAYKISDSYILALRVSEAKNIQVKKVEI